MINIAKKDCVSDMTGKNNEIDRNSVMSAKSVATVIKPKLILS